MTLQVKRVPREEEVVRGGPRRPDAPFSPFAKRCVNSPLGQIVLELTLEDVLYMARVARGVRRLHEARSVGPRCVCVRVWCWCVRASMYSEAATGVAWRRRREQVAAVGVSSAAAVGRSGGRSAVGGSPGGLTSTEEPWRQAPRLGEHRQRQAAKRWSGRRPGRWRERIE